MAATDISRLGQDLATGSENALFLKVFGGEVLATFQEANKFMPLQMTRTISSGKSAAFPVIGTAGAHWHTPGESVIADADAGGVAYLSKVKHTEREIFIDDCMVSSVLIDDLDSLKNHYDHRSEYSSAIGRALALEADKHILSVVLAAANAPANIPGVTSAGQSVNVADMDTSTSVFVSACFTAAEKLDDNDIPKEDRYVAVRPAHYWKLVQDTNLVNRDFGGTNGVYSDGTVYKVAGFTIVATNNMPSDTTNDSAVDDTGAKNDPQGTGGIGYNANWTNVEALCFHKSCAGTVKMADIQVMSEYQVERLANLLVAKYAMGHNYLRPEAAVALRDVD
jgi:hypothetical protein